MKKVLRILLITLGVILLLLIILPILFKSKIESVVKEKVNEEVHATVDWSRFNLSFFRGFPDLSINLHQVSVVGLEPFEGDTLVGLERFELRVNPFSAIRKNIVVKSILVDRPLVNGLVLEDGTANWDITSGSDPETVVEEEETTEEGGGSSMTLSLKRFAILDGRIYYLDQNSAIDASLEGFNLELQGNFSMDETQMQLSAGIEKINARMGGVRYMKDGNFDMQIEAAANMVENRYTLEKNLISLNGLTLGAEGEVTLMDEGAMAMDLRFFSKETSFHTLLSLVPAIYLKDFESLKTSGKLQLEGTVTGTMKDSILPDATLKLRVTDGYFAYPDLPKDVTDVQVALNVDYKGTNMDATTVNLERFHLLLGGNPFDLNLKVDHPVSDMHVAGVARGTIDFASLKDVVPMEDLSLDGKLETDLRWDTRMSYIEQELYDQVDLEGKLVIEDVVVEAPDIPVPVELTKLHMDFNPRFVELLTLDLNMGSSDLHMDGELANFVPYVFNNQTLSGSLNVTSQLLNANELLPEVEEDDTPEATDVVSDTLLPVPSDSLAEPALIRIPENIEFSMDLDMKRVEYDKIVMENISGEMKVTEGVAILDHLSMEVTDGTMNTSGWVDTRGEFMEVDLSMDMKGMDIPVMYETFISVERLMPMVRFSKGTANIDMEYASKLDASFNPLYESINAKGRVFTKGLQFYKLDSFIPLSEMLKNEKFQEMAPDEVNVGFTIQDGRIMFDPFDMNVDDSKITVSGSHGIDHTLDYLFDMNIAKSDLGEGANEMMKGISVMAASAGIKIPESDYVKVKANITGTFNKPRVKTDLSGNLKSAGETVKEAVEAKVVEEVEKVEEQVREEAGEEAELIISDAEAEADRLIEAARKAGEELVKESEKQGENLIEEAGTSVLKQIAAKRAAEELKKQAVKQSDNLVKEAEVKAAEIIQKARDEAAKI
ncbi:MAG: AsmA family protein [Bacteroidales bacterium]|nr:AsmA family protein [Bacteroidales bacterium]